MRSNWMIPALSLVLVLAACGKREEKSAALPDDLKQDLARVSSSGDLSTAPQGYQRARFVSAIEQSHTAQPAKRLKRAPHHAAHAMVAHVNAAATTTDVADEPVMAMAAETPQPVSTPAATAPEPTIVVAPTPAPDPIRTAGGGSDAGVGDQGRGGGLGGLLGGIFGGVVIRGGHGGVDKCDPRTDGRARPTIDVPIFIQPTFPGRPFPGSRRR